MSPREGGGEDHRELLRYLGRGDLARLWLAVRERLERGEGVRGAARLAGATPEERRAVAGLLGLPAVPEGDLRVRLDRLDRALRASRFAIGLRSAMELAGGPLRDRAEESARVRRWREELWERAAGHPAVGERPELRRWLSELRAGGQLRRAAAAAAAREAQAGAARTAAAGDPAGPTVPAAGLRAAEAAAVAEERLLARALDVLHALGRRRGEVRLQVLASLTLGTSHGLDPGRPAASLAVHGLAFLAGLPPPRNAAERRACWERAGVIVDELSCDVLTLGVAPLGDSAVAVGLRAFAGAVEPVWITLRQLAAGDLVFPPGLAVRVCENPVVVAAAADLRLAGCGPLVCLSGFPNQAGRKLLALLVRSGAVLHYHGDFDWPGLRIGNHLHATAGFLPWRFSAADYRRAVRALQPEVEHRGLGGVATEAVWDPALGAAMRETGIAVEEESVLAELLADWQDGGDRRGP